MSKNLVERFRGWVIGAIALGALCTLVASLWAGFDGIAVAIRTFPWVWMIPVVCLTLLNYGLRFAKWHYLLGRLGVAMPLREDALNFASGLAMVISPGKAGELLKPYVVRARTGAPMATTIPALITERLTDGIAMLLLAGIGVTTYASDRIHLITIPAGITALGLVVLSSAPLMELALHLLDQIPGLRRAVPRLRVMVVAMRRCVAPAPLLLTVGMSVVAWGAECLGYLIVLRGVGAAADFGQAVFVYAFATVAGGAMPGGLGVADGALMGLPMALVDGLTQPQAFVAATLIRLATLWLGVGIGAVALFRVSALLGGGLSLETEAPGPRSGADVQ